jgi:hypothetical protein
MKQLAVAECTQDVVVTLIFALADIVLRQTSRELPQPVAVRLQKLARIESLDAFSRTFVAKQDQPSPAGIEPAGVVSAGGGAAAVGVVGGVSYVSFS